MGASDEGAARRLDALRALLTTAHGLVAELAGDPLLDRLLRAFLTLPRGDRETIVRVVERDATWRRIADETFDTTRIAVHPNPHASLYVHVFDQVTGRRVEPEPSARDANVIRLGIGSFVRVIPLLFQEDVHAQWAPLASELAHAADPETRAATARLAEEVLALIAQAEAEDPSSRRRATS